MAFNVRKHLIKVQGGRLYLPVAARLVWFREEHPDWGIETRMLELNMEKGHAVFEAYVYNEQGKLMAKGTKMETRQGFHDFVEKAETGSIGRALAVCGFGTQFAPDMFEGGVVDSPIEQRSGSARFERAERGAGDGAALGGERKLQCSSCSSPITAAQHDLSKGRFGEPLCPACQKQRNTSNGNGNGRARVEASVEAGE